ncbi:hypothetical protein BHE97_12185 [Aeromicrobium sp. PE09-221]|uniref:extracellular solute-binding protein n=1 Tax=Aeromicrobium sp. PE09-221 TaxID=1898043 RepID=UPI000B3E8640|nr:extracellular solute-binding protein [Aeromicrobium sp. PE09-221]OUZ08885.1 hypothetical protein BHE97_12185 [Aeromicrobium sp. PE09-221]
MFGLRRRSLVALPVAAAMALSLSACGNTDDDDSSDESGSLVIYSARDQELVEDLVDRFEEAHPEIDVEVHYGDDFGVAKVLEENAVGNVQPDIYWSQEAGSLGVLANEGVTQTLPENITSQIDPAFTSDDGSWVGLTGRIRVFAHNSELIDEAEVPDTIAEFADPQWAGRFDLPPTNATFQAFVTAMRLVEGEDATRVWLEAVRDNLPEGERPSNNGGTLDLVEAGTVEIGLVNHYYLYERAAGTENGLDDLATRNKIAAVGDLGSMVNVTGVAALSDNPAALTFIEFLLSEESQAWFAETSFEYPLVAGAPTPEGLPPLTDFIDTNAKFDLNDLSDLEATVALLQEVGLL